MNRPDQVVRDVDALERERDDELLSLCVNGQLLDPTLATEPAVDVVALRDVDELARALGFRR